MRANILENKQVEIIGIEILKKYINWFILNAWFIDQMINYQSIDEHSDKLMKDWIK